MNKPTAIFILGMHRSGTSALAGALAQSGLWMGDDLLEPAPGINDKGFWEHKELVRINEALLHNAGLQWYSPFASKKLSEFLKKKTAAILVLKKEAKRFAAKLLEGEHGKGTTCIAIKDPRLCLTANFWKTAFEESGARVVGLELIRHPAEVARSLERRDGIVASHSNLLWLDYVSASAAFCQSLDIRFTGSFDGLMASPTAFTEAALISLGVDQRPDQGKLNSWIQADLRHHQHVHIQAEGVLGKEVTTLYLERLKHQPLSSATVEKLAHKVAGVASDLEQQFKNYNSCVIKLQNLSSSLENLGAEHSIALDTLKLRDQQLQDVQKNLERIGKEHSKALDTITQRDEQLSKLNSEKSAVEKLHQQSLEEISKLRREIGTLSQKLSMKESSFTGKLSKALKRTKKLASKKFFLNGRNENLTPKAGETVFPENGKRPLVDVIIPVYGGLEETKSAVETAAASIDKAWARLVIINDCSPEPEITAWLQKNQQPLGYELLENKENLGFVRTVNRGMKLRPEADVLLLNSDVEVANDWLERLQDCAYSREKVASVTATANNATICSFPVFCEDNELPQGLDVQSLDQVFKQSVPINMAVEIPSGIGCCMYMRRDCMNAIGLFDEETFGRGYGEENDWCQRAIKDGWTNLHALNVFIYHKGSVSFANESNPRKEENLRKLVERYPAYNADVQAFILQDPARSWRVRLLCELLARSERPLSVAIAHGLGGGVYTHIYELAREISEIDFLLIEPVEGERVRLSLLPLKKDASPSIEFFVPKDYDQLVALLQAMGVGHVHFHHTMRVPTKLWGLPKDLRVPYDYTLHDFWVVNGNPTLTGPNGIYAGDGHDRDELCAKHYPLPDGVTSGRWRELQLPLMDEARHLITPSKDTKDRISREREFSHLASWVVSPHLDHSDLTEDVLPLNPTEGKLKVAILGALSKEKGADILEAVANKLSNAGIEFHLLGYAYRPLAKSVITHGPYPENEALQRLLDLEPDIVWFTAQWPETYSYTLSIAIKAKLPIVAPNLGAFPERLAGRKNTALLERWNDAESVSKFWEHLKQDSSSIDRHVKQQSLTEDSLNLRFYHSSYLNGINPKKSQADRIVINELHQAGSFDSTCERQSHRELILHTLLRLRNNRLAFFAFKLAPISFQRRVKRFLSRKPIHEIK